MFGDAVKHIVDTVKKLDELIVTLYKTNELLVNISKQLSSIEKNQKEKNGK